MQSVKILIFSKLTNLMNKFVKITFSSMVGLNLLMNASLAFAQTRLTTTTLTTIPTNITGVVTSAEPIPATGNTATTGTTAGTTTTGTRGTTSTGTRGTTGTTMPQATDIPIVPTISQQTTATNDTPSTSTLVCTQDQCASTVRKAMGNEIIVMTVLMMGSVAGGILWALALLMTKKGSLDRESRRLERQNRFSFERMVTAEKTTAYNSYIDKVMNAINNLQHKKALAPQDFSDLQESGIYIDIHGSKHLRVMNEHIMSIIKAGKPLSTADQIHLKTELSKMIKADLI